MKLSNRKISSKRFQETRSDVLSSWPTGSDVSLKDGIAYQRSLNPRLRASLALAEAERRGDVLLQPRGGVALVEEHIELLRSLERESDLLPTTIDAYTRQNRYEEAARGVEKSRTAGHSLLNGFPAVTHGLKECRRVIESVRLPVEVRHGTPDARLLAEISLAAGFSSFEGGGISYNVPYAKQIPLDRSISDWQYVDRLVGEYQEAGVTINREPFGPLSGTLIPPCISHAVAIVEGLLALSQGVRSISLGYGQGGNMVQDVAAMRTLKRLAHKYFRELGFREYELTTVFHQWMGGFPEDEAKAFAVISLGGTVGALAKATKIIVKTPHEAMGIPTKEANLAGLKATRQAVNMVRDQRMPDASTLEDEIELITREVGAIMSKVLELGDSDPAKGAVRAFEAGVIDVPFAPSLYNRGRLLPVRDQNGAVRIYEPGSVPFDEDTLAFHRHQLEKRGESEGRKPSFQMVIDDIYAIGKGRLVGRPRNQ